MNAITIALVPDATPVTVSVVATPAAVPVTAVDVGDTVAFPVDPLVAVNVPATLPLAAPDFTVAVYVILLPATTVPLVADSVIVGVAFAILHVIDFVPVVLSLHLYPLDNFADTV